MATDQCVLRGIPEDLLVSQKSFKAEVADKLNLGFYGKIGLNGSSLNDKTGI